MIKTKLKSRCVNEIALKAEFVRVSRTQLRTAVAAAGARPGSSSQMLPPDSEAKPKRRDWADQPLYLQSKFVAHLQLCWDHLLNPSKNVLVYSTLFTENH